MRFNRVHISSFAAVDGVVFLISFAIFYSDDDAQVWVKSARPRLAEGEVKQIDIAHINSDSESDNDEGKDKDNGKGQDKSKAKGKRKGKAKAKRGRGKAKSPKN